MARYIKPQRGEPTNEEFMALFILIGPLAFIVRWIWRAARSARGFAR